MTSCRKLIVVLSLIVCCVLCAAPKQQAKAPQIRYVNVRSVTYLYLEDVAKFYGMTMKVDGKKVTLSSNYSTLSFTLNSRVMELNGVQVHLSRPLCKAKDVLVMGKSDFMVILEPILRSRTLKKHNVRTIVIDPGHGGKDVGAVSGNIYEKDINLQVAMRLASKLQARGYKICMTRTKDTDIGLEDRVKFANNCKPDVFISLHCNSASATVTGLEVYIATPFGDPMTGDDYVSKGSCPANAFNAENAFLAFYAQRGILTRTGMEDRGIRRRRFYVVRNVAAPCMLVEMGFISNAVELAELRKPYRQEQIADALVETVVKYKDATK